MKKKTREAAKRARFTVSETWSHMPASALEDFEEALKGYEMYEIASQRCEKHVRRLMEELEKHPKTQRLLSDLKSDPATERRWTAEEDDKRVLLIDGVKQLLPSINELLAGSTYATVAENGSFWDDVSAREIGWLRNSARGDEDELQMDGA